MKTAALALRRAGPIALAAAFLLAAGCSKQSSETLRIQGPGRQPELGFACCDQGLDAAQRLFAQPAVVEQLQALHATVAIPIEDFSPQQVALVRQITGLGIPVVAGVGLPANEGSYLNAGNVRQAKARIAAFEQWSRANNLHFAAVGLDIEPNFSQLEQLSHHRWRLAWTLLRRSIAFSRMARARQAYAALITQIQAWGDPVLVDAMPYIPLERELHTTVVNRLVGTPDVRGNRTYVMLYTSFARPASAGVIPLLGSHADAIAIGITAGPGTPGVGFGPLDWAEFSRDLLLAGHFTRYVGVYNLEGCVQQGFLPRLATFNWSRTVVIPAASMRRARRHIGLFRFVLWILADLPWLVAAALLLLALVGLAWRRRKRARSKLPERYA